MDGDGPAAFHIPFTLQIAFRQIFIRFPRPLLLKQITSAAISVRIVLPVSLFGRSGRLLYSFLMEGT